MKTVFSSGKAPCLKCLIRDLPDEQELHQILQERIEQLDPDQRCAELVRQTRLNQCLQCSSLNHGTCTECGCYVEVRSARKNMDCPHVPSLWLK